MTPMRIGLLPPLVVLALVACGGCAENEHSDALRDCNASVRLQGAMYRFDTRINQHAPVDRPLGRGDVVDCDDAQTVVVRVTVFALKGVERDTAVRVIRGDWHGTYVAEDLPPTAWPSALRP